MLDVGRVQHTARMYCLATNMFTVVDRHSWKDEDVARLGPLGLYLGPPRRSRRRNSWRRRPLRRARAHCGGWAVPGLPGNATLGLQRQREDVRFIPLAG